MHSLTYLISTIRPMFRGSSQYNGEINICISVTDFVFLAFCKLLCMELHSRNLIIFPYFALIVFTDLRLRLVYKYVSKQTTSLIHGYISAE